MLTRHAAPGWSTACDGHAAVTRPAELHALGEHLGDCRARSGPLFALQCGGEAVRTFVAARLVTTLTIALTLIGIAAMVF